MHVLICIIKQVSFINLLKQVNVYLGILVIPDIRYKKNFFLKIEMCYRWFNLAILTYELMIYRNV